MLALIHFVLTYFPSQTDQTDCSANFKRHLNCDVVPVHCKNAPFYRLLVDIELSRSGKFLFLYCIVSGIEFIFFITSIFCILLTVIISSHSSPHHQQVGWGGQDAGRGHSQAGCLLLTKGIFQTRCHVQQ